MRRMCAWLFSELHTTYCILYVLHTEFDTNNQYAICSHCSTQAGYSECISHRQAAIARFYLLIFFIKLQQQMPGQSLVKTSQHIALWETVGKIDWLDECWGFPLKSVSIQDFFAYCRFCLCLNTYILHTRFWANQYILHV